VDKGTEQLHEADARVHRRETGALRLGEAAREHTEVHRQDAAGR
jgi:hypothetical protein